MGKTQFRFFTIVFILLTNDHFLKAYLTDAILTNNYNYILTNYNYVIITLIVNCILNIIQISK